MLVGYSSALQLHNVLKNLERYYKSCAMLVASFIGNERLDWTLQSPPNRLCCQYGAILFPHRHFREQVFFFSDIFSNRFFFSQTFFCTSFFFSDNFSHKFFFHTHFFERVNTYFINCCYRSHSGAVQD